MASKPSEPLGVDGDGAEDLAALEERGRDDRADAVVADERVALRRVLEAVVGQVVAGHLDDPGGDGQAGHAGTHLDVDLGAGRAVRAGPRGRPCRPRAGQRGQPEQVEHRAVGAQQALGRIGHGLQDLALVAHRADPGGDLAQRPLGIGGPGQVGAGLGQLTDEPGIGDGDGGLAGQGADEVGIGVVERVALRRVDLDDAERAVVAGDRRGDHRVEAGALVELGRLGRGREQARPARRRR